MENGFHLITQEKTMGYTLHQIHTHFNEVVKSYKYAFTEVPCSQVVEYTSNGINRSVILQSKRDSSVTVKVTFNSKRIFDNKSSRYFNVIEISTDKFNSTGMCYSYLNKRFYCVGKNYYSTDILDAIQANKKNEDRFISKTNYGTTQYLDLEKLSNKTKSYIHKLVSSKLDLSKDAYNLYDVYFSYRDLGRELAIVIKRDNKNFSETLWFDKKDLANSKISLQK
jgi:hypothetical protein